MGGILCRLLGVPYTGGDGGSPEGDIYNGPHGVLY